MTRGAVIVQPLWPLPVAQYQDSFLVRFVLFLWSRFHPVFPKTTVSRDSKKADQKKKKKRFEKTLLDCISFHLCAKKVFANLKPSFGCFHKNFVILETFSRNNSPNKFSKE